MPCRLSPRWTAGAFLVAVALGAAGCGSQHATRRSAGTRTVVPGSVAFPVWSPDGKWIAWTEVVPGVGAQVWTAKPDMSHAHTVTPAIDALGKIALLPGRELVYDANSRLFLMKPGHASRLISRVAGYGFAIDSRDTAVVTGDPPCPSCFGNVLVVSLLGGGVRRINSDYQSVSPAFSPDGTRLVLDRTRCRRSTGRCDGPTGIWTAAIGTGAVRQLTVGGSCPSWSPDGRAIAYVDNFRGTLRVVPSDGGTSRIALRGIGGCNLTFPPSWAPDSRGIAAVKSSTGQLVFVEVPSHKSRLLTGLAIGTAVGFAWSPDSAKLLVAAQPPVAHPCASLWLVNAKTAAARRLRSCG